MRERVLKYWMHLVYEAPDAIVLYTPSGDAITRRAVDAASDRLCGEWEEAGVRPRRLLALNLYNGENWLASFLACLKAGVVAVALDPGFGREEVIGIARDLRADAVWDGETLERGLVEKPFVFRNKDVEVGKLTSGSTGRQKKLFFTGAEMLADARQLIGTMGIRPHDVNLGLIPWGHSYGLGNIVYPLLLQGTPVAWTETPFPIEMAATCRRAKCTVFPSVPTVIRALARSDLPATDFESLRLVISAGARLDPAVAQAFYDRFGKRPRNFYGSTETGGICFDDTGEASLTGRSVGKPIAGVEIVPARGKRFYVKSAAVYRYGNRKRSAAGEPQALVADLGRIDERGELVLESRAINLMKIGARRINPLDIERRLLAIEGVSDAKVFPLEREGDAIIAAGLETCLPRRDLAKLIKEAVPLRLRPKKWLGFERFPVTARGKTDFGAIRGEFVSEAR